MIAKINKTLLIIFLGIFPAFILNIFANPFDMPKILLLALVLTILIVTLGIEIAIKGKLDLKLSSLDIPLILLTISLVVSAVVKTPNKMEAFFFPGSALIFILGLILYFFIKMVFENDKKQVSIVLFFSGVLVCLLSLMSFLEVFIKIQMLPSFIKDPSFSPIGGKLPEIIFLTALLPLGIGAMIKQKETVKKALFGLSLLIIVITLTLDVSFVLPGKLTAPILPGTSESWSVAVDAIKESPLLGVGPGNYQSAFSRFVPLSHNSTLFWSVRFTSARSFVLTLATEAGFLGLIAFGLVLFLVAKLIASKYKDMAAISLAIIAISFLLLPANLTVITLFFVLASVLTNDKEKILKLPRLISALLFFLTGIIVFLGIRGFLAEAVYKKSIDAIVKNDGKLAYDSLRVAIEMNPLVDRYHTTYSQVNLALAQSISQKKDVSEKEKETVAQLIQQAIREGKAAVTLNPQRSTSWEQLARTYQTVMPFAQGADNFTIQTFTQAIALDPINPNLRIGLGSVYYALGRYDEAIDTFKLAIAAKPDLANSHYNLALAYREKKEIEKATSELNTVLSLVEKDSPDYKLTVDELNNLRKNNTETEGTENLTPPQSVEESQTQVELPEEAAPPQN